VHPKHSISIYSTCKSSRSKKQFLESLATDLHKIGITCALHQQGKKLEFKVCLRPFEPSEILELMKKERAIRLQRQKAFIQQMEAQGAFCFLLEGKTLVPMHIKPRLQFCNSPKEHNLFNLYGAFQSVPAPSLRYRRLAVLVRDDGHNGSPIMGIFGLSSCFYSLGCRDRFLGWVGAENRQLKNKGLNSCMQLSICMALPPYSYIRVGRLLAALAASNVIANEFSRRYSSREQRNELRAIVTTCASGLHAPIFNRIMLVPGGLYKRIGETVGYSTLFFSKETLAAARILVREQEGACSSITARSVRTLKMALNICGIPRERLLRFGISKGVYLAAGGLQSIEYLRGTINEAITTWPTVEQIVSYWKSRDLPKALADDKHVRAMTEFRPEEFIQSLKS